MSEKAALEQDAERHYLVKGSLTVTTLPELWPALEHAARTPDDVEISLAHVIRADSAAVAALVACTRLAHESGGRLRFADLPESMRVIIEVSDLDELLESASRPA